MAAIEQVVNQPRAAEFLLHTDTMADRVSKMMPPPFINVMIDDKIPSEEDRFRFFR